MEKSFLHQIKNQKSTKIALAATEIKYLPKEIDPAGIVNTGSGGGLSRIMATLGEAAYEAGLDVKFIIPEYYDLFRQNSHQMSEKEFNKEFNRLATHPNIFFADSGLFTNAKKVYGDYSYNLDKIDSKRAVEFSKGIVRASRQLNRMYPDAKKIFQLNEWSTGLAAAPIKAYDIDNTIKTEMKYHNFHTEKRKLFKLVKEGFNAQKYYNKLFYNQHPNNNYEKDMFNLEADFLLSGIHAADLVTTVSDQYLNEAIAKSINENPIFREKEIFQKIIKKMNDGVLQADPVMSSAMAKLIAEKFMAGQANAVSNRLESISNPELDPNLPENLRFGTNNMLYGKNNAKLILQKKAGLKVGKDYALGAWGNRFNMDDAQKGLKTYLPVLGNFLRENPNLQQVFTCDIAQGSENEFNEFKKAFPGQVGHLPFSNANESLMMAAADRIDLPSLYEPGGFPNKTGKIYGVLALVRNTGGLAETVDYGTNKNDFTGFKFNDLDEGGIRYGLESFLNYYNKGPEYREQNMQRIRKQGLIDENPQRLIDDYIPIWENLIGEKIIYRQD